MKAVRIVDLGVAFQVQFDAGKLFVEIGRQRDVVLAEGVVPVSQQFASATDQEAATAQQVTRRPHLAGIDVAHREGSAAQQSGDLFAVDLVVFGLATVDRSHVQGVAEHEGDLLLDAQIREPVPGEHAFGTDDQLFPIGLDGPQEILGAGSDPPRALDFTCLIAPT